MIMIRVMISYILRVYEKILAGVKTTAHAKIIASPFNKKSTRSENFGNMDCMNIAKAGTAR